MENSLIELTQSVINFFYSPWTKGVCCILLIGEAIGLWFGSSNNRGGVFKVFVPMMIGTVLFMCAGSLALGYGKIMGYDMTDKIKLPAVSSGIKSNSLKSLDSGSGNNSNGIISQNDSSGDVNDSASSNSSTAEADNSNGTSSSSNPEIGTSDTGTGSGSSGTAGDNAGFDWNSYAQTASNKDFNNKVNETMASGSYTNAVSLITSSAESSSRMGITQTGLGYMEGTSYDLGTGVDYFISDSGDIYTKMNDSYGYDEGGNLVKLSTQEKLDKMSLSNPEHENYYWSLLKKKD